MALCLFYTLSVVLLLLLISLTIDIANATGMTPDDIISTSQRHNILVFQDNQYVFHLDEQEIQRQVQEMESKQKLRLDPSKLSWKPYQLPQLSYSYDEDDEYTTDDDELSIKTTH